MPYPYLIFLSLEKPPSPATIRAEMRQRGHELSHHPEYEPDDEMEQTWATLGLCHSPNQPPVIIETERREGVDAFLMHNELNRAAGQLEQANACPGRHEALSRLRQAHLMISLQTDRHDEKGGRIAEALSKLFESYAGSLLWVGAREFFLDGKTLEHWENEDRTPSR